MPRSCARGGTRSALLVLAFALLGPGEIGAATFPVADAAGLIAAIADANTTPEDDSIDLTGDVTLSAVDNTTNGPNGTPPIVTPVTIRGHGFAISRETGAPAFRLLIVLGGFFGDGALTLDGVRLTGGDVSAVPTDCFIDLDGCGGALLSLFGDVTARNGTVFAGNAAFGGGAFFNAGGNATLANPTFLANTAERGGALYNTGGLIGDPATILVRAGRFEANASTLDGGAIHNQAELDVVDAVFALNRVTGVPPFGGGGGAIHNTTLNGQARVAGSSFTGNEAVRGGALSNYNASDLTLVQCEVRGNRTNNFGAGGGIWSDNNTSLAVLGSRVVENEAVTFGDAGGIYSGQNNALTLVSSVVSDNTAADDGGGVYMDSVNEAVVSTIVNSRIDSNAAGGDGGGVYKNGASPLSIVASSISDNVGQGQNGGGLAVEGGSLLPSVGVTVSDSTIARNRMLTGDGGGISNEAQGRLAILRSAIVDNEVTGAGGVSGLGGGIYSNQTNSRVTVENSTISGNHAQSNGGGTYNNNASQMTLTHTTITGNVADLQGGGVYALATTSLRGAVIAGNTANHPVNARQHNCGGLPALFNDLGANFTNDANAICPAGFTVSPSINLGPLADNGGPTATHALLPGSVAIDAVPGCGLATDQRGVPRPAACDAGAWDGDVVVPLVGFVTSASTVDESAGTPHAVQVILNNEAGTVASASATVHVAIVGTAASGIDYDLAVSPPLVFAGATWPPPGDTRTLVVSFELTPDVAVERPETIRLELRDAGITGPADLGAIDVHTVTVLDACPPSPDPACTTGFAKGTVKIDEKKAGKEKLLAQLKNGPLLTQHDFGDPLSAGGTSYRLCLYDDPTQPVASITIDRAGDECGGKPCWKPIGGAPPDGKGFLLKDKAASAGGTKLLKLAGGKAGKTQVRLVASNQSGALPTGVAAALASSSGGVTVQLATSDADCFSRTFTEVTKRAPDRFQAK